MPDVYVRVVLRYNFSSGDLNPFSMTKEACKFFKKDISQFVVQKDRTTFHRTKFDAIKISFGIQGHEWLPIAFKIEDDGGTIYVIEDINSYDVVGDKKEVLDERCDRYIKSEWLPCSKEDIPQRPYD